LKAIDNDNPALTSTAIIKINILDANDNKPVFNPPTYSHSIREDAAVGLSLLTVRVTFKHLFDWDHTWNSKAHEKDLLLKIDRDDITLSLLILKEIEN